jgi:hypothetical protein
MQLSRRNRAPGVKRKGFLAVAKDIVRRETVLGLYKGLGAVVTGIVPKMAIRFSSFEFYKGLAKVHPETGKVSAKAVFLSGLMAGATEAVAVVTPMEGIYMLAPVSLRVILITFSQSSRFACRRSTIPWPTPSTPQSTAMRRMQHTLLSERKDSRRFTEG